jgi:hypothetical protein
VIHWVVRLSPAIVLVSWAFVLTWSLVWVILLGAACVAAEVERVSHG